MTGALLDVAIDLPAPKGDWLDITKAAFFAYAESDAARVLRAEDIMELVTLFQLIDQRNRYIVNLTGIGADDEPTLRALKMADTMIARMSGNLGVGPLARTRLGISVAERARREDEQAERRQAASSSDF